MSDYVDDPLAFPRGCFWAFLLALPLWLIMMYAVIQSTYVNPFAERDTALPEDYPAVKGISSDPLHSIERP